MYTETTLEAEVRSIVFAEQLADPFPTWNRLRETAPIYEFDGAVLFSRFDDVKAMLTDARFSNKYFITGNRADQIVSRFSEETRRMWHEMADIEQLHLTRSDGEDHARRRRIAHRYFSPPRIAELELFVQRVADELLGELAESEVGDYKRLARTLPLRVVMQIIGSPQADTAAILAWTETIALYLGSSDEQVVRDAYAARLEFKAYVEDVLVPEHRRNRGSNPLIAAMMDAEDDENLTPDELIAMVGLLLFSAHETTSSLLATGLIELLKRPDQWALLTADPGRVPRAVEELLRFTSPAQWTNRVAAEDIDWNGFEIAKGQTMMGIVAAANRDPSIFDEPDRLDLDRSGPNHLGLGFGTHFCLGASLLRKEAEVVYGTLCRRYPEIELAADPAELVWGGNPILRNVRELPVRLGPRRDG